MFRSGRRAARALHTCVSLGPKFIAALLTALALWAGAPTRAAAQDAFFKFLNGTQEEAYAELKKRHDKAAEAKANLEILKATGHRLVLEAMQGHRRQSRRDQGGAGGIRFSGLHICRIGALVSSDV